MVINDLKPSTQQCLRTISQMLVETGLFNDLQCSMPTAAEQTSIHIFASPKQLFKDMPEEVLSTGSYSYKIDDLDKLVNIKDVAAAAQAAFNVILTAYATEGRKPHVTKTSTTSRSKRTTKSSKSES